MHDKLYNPDYLYSLCKNYGLQPSKKYGQNYLINPLIIEKIIDAADLSKNDTIVEVGPGFGVLTFPLAQNSKQVISFEIEKKLESYWQDRKPDNLSIVWGNVLKGSDSLPKGKYKVVANLPYQITSAVIRAFLEAKNQPENMVLMVQKEVAERICAEPGDMSLLSVSVQYYADAEIIDFVARDNFWPEPKVDSAIIKLYLKKQRHEENSDVLFRVVKAGFSSRRKLLTKNLEPIIGKKNKSDLKKIFSDLSIRETARAQELSVDDWISLTEIIRKKYE